MDEVIAQFEKNATEVVRVSLSEYRGRKLIDLRVFYSDDAGEYRPTRKGVSLNVDSYPEFKNALMVLEKILLERNLVTSEALAACAAAVEEEES